MAFFGDLCHQHPQVAQVGPWDERWPSDWLVLWKIHKPPESETSMVDSWILLISEYLENQIL